MVDGGEQADAEQRERQRLETRRKPDQHAADAGAEEIDRDHVATAPLVGEPAGGQCKQSECRECGGREHQEVAVGAAVHGFQPDHDGRKNQDHIVVEEMRPVEEADRAAAGAVVLNCHGNPAWFGVTL
jgi:hypothetical protein